MSPSSLHESPVSALSDVVGDFTREIGYDRTMLKARMYTNKHLRYKGPRQEEDRRDIREVVPDFQLTIEVNEGKKRTIPKWVGEVAFTSSAPKARDRLRELGIAKPSIDLAFLFSIQESPKWESPGIDNPSARRLHAEPFVDFDDFDPTIEGNGMGPVTFRGIVWASIARLVLEVYVRSPTDGKLVVKVDQQSKYSARAVCYQFTYVPFLMNS